MWYNEKTHLTRAGKTFNANRHRPRRNRRAQFPSSRVATLGQRSRTAPTGPHESGNCPGGRCSGRVMAPQKQPSQSPPLERCNDVRDKRKQGLVLVIRSHNSHDAKRTTLDVLLMFDPLIHRKKSVKLSFSTVQPLSIGYSRPSAIRNRAPRTPSLLQTPLELAGNVLVAKDVQRSSRRSSVSARSTNASACSRRTDGRSPKNSSRRFPCFRC